MAYVVGILARDIDNYWSKVVPMVLRSLERINDGATQDSIYLDLIHKDKQLWVAYNEQRIIGCIITQIISCPELKKLFYYIVAGDDFNSWWHERKQIEAWGRSQGCTEVEFCGRLGWQKRLKKEGYKTIYLGMTKQL